MGISRELFKKKNLDKAESILDPLEDKFRLKVIQFIVDYKPNKTKEIAKHFKKPVGNTSPQLKQLIEGGYITSTREGKARRIEIHFNNLKRIADILSRFSKSDADMKKNAKKTSSRKK